MKAPPVAIVEQLYRGLADNTVSKVIDAILRAELVVIDERGFTPLDLVDANHLFRLVSAAYETRSLVVTSNWPFEQWTNFLPDVTAASAILDRVCCITARSWFWKAIRVAGAKREEAHCALNSTAAQCRREWYRLDACRASLLLRYAR